MKIYIFACFITLCLGKDLVHRADSWHDRSPKVVGGEEAKLGEIPYQVSLQLMGQFETRHYCGGVLISASTVLTTGGCANVTAGPFEHLIATAGFVNLKQPGEYQQKKAIIKTIVHPDYTGGTTLNNLAIYILDTPFTLDEYVNVIALPQAETIPSGNATISGWGSITANTGVALPDVLQRDNLPIVPIEECIPIIEDLGFPLDETMVCTGPYSGGHGACAGDSGGPLVAGSGENRTLVGVVSWTLFPCARYNKPSVYTRVSHYLDFINSNIV